MNNNNKVRVALIKVKKIRELFSTQMRFLGFDQLHLRIRQVYGFSATPHQYLYLSRIMDLHDLCYCSFLIFYVLLPRIFPLVLPKVD